MKPEKPDRDLGWVLFAWSIIVIALGLLMVAVQSIQ